MESNIYFTNIDKTYYFILNFQAYLEEGFTNPKYFFEIFTANS